MKKKYSNKKEKIYDAIQIFNKENGEARIAFIK